MFRNICKYFWLHVSFKENYSSLIFWTLVFSFIVIPIKVILEQLLWLINGGLINPPFRTPPLSWSCNIWLFSHWAYINSDFLAQVLYFNLYFSSPHMKQSNFSVITVNCSELLFRAEKLSLTLVMAKNNIWNSDQLKKKHQESFTIIC
jgi:hypothetical protein